MKKRFILLFFIGICQIVEGQTEFAPVGAKWWVLIDNFFSEIDHTDNYECTGTLDTLGHTCKVVRWQPSFGPERHFYFYQEGESVFVYNASQNMFVRIFDYEKQAGEQYQIIEGTDTTTFYVDSVSTLLLANENIMVQHGHTVNPNVPFDEPYNAIYRGIGTDNGLWPRLPSELTSEIWSHLICYAHPNGNLYDFSSPWMGVNCQSLYTSTNEPNISISHFNFFPNPVGETLTIELMNPFHFPTSILLFDPLGIMALRKVMASGQRQEQVNVSELPPGLYFWRVEGEGKMLGSGKLLIVK